MAKQRPPLNLVPATPRPTVLPAEEQLLWDDMLRGWTAKRRGAQGHTEKTMKRDLTVLADFAAFTGMPPWLQTNDQFHQWCFHLHVDRGLKPTTQRHYQTAIREFHAYIIGNIRFRSEVRRLFGIELEQIAPIEECIPHVTDREATTERLPFSHEQVATFFQAVDDAIYQAAQWRTKGYHPFRRDKAMFFTVYALGLRASETLGLDTTSFFPHPDRPEFGSFGMATVWGKGSRGSGPKNRHVPCLHPKVPPLLEWYLEEVRPAFLVQADPNEKALFLSERGTRLKISTLEYRFQMIIGLAELDGLDLTPHCLRHTFATHARKAGLSLHATQKTLGHEYPATTDGYVHYTSGDVAEEVDEFIGRVFSQENAKNEEGKE